MRVAGKRSLRRAMRKEIKRRSETRDAVIVSIDTLTRTIYVKVQGNPWPIPARYPVDWCDPQRLPHWLKVGNSVQIRHRGGVRQRVDLLGPGLLIPGDTVLSDPPVGEDAILSGMSIHQVSGVDLVMAVWVEVGYYRIDDVTYELEPVPLGYEIPLGWDIPIGYLGGIVWLGVPPTTGTYRFDIIVIGTDGVLDVVQGVADNTDPQIPDTPAGHVLVGSILMWPNMTGVRSVNFTEDFEESVPTYITVVPDDVQMLYETDETDVTVTVYDQRGLPMGGPLETGWYITLEMVQGTGWLYSPDEGISYESVGGWTGYTNSSYVFTYFRAKEGAGSVLEEMDYYTMFPVPPNVIDAKPVGWTDRWHNSAYGKFRIQSSDYGYGNASVKFSRSITNRYLLTWDEPSSVFPKDLQVLAKIRCAVDSGAWGYVELRASGTTTSEWGVFVYFSMGGQQFLMRRHYGSAESVLLDSMEFTHVNGGDYWVRFQGVGQEFKARAWAVGSVEPDTWGLEADDYAIGEGGWVGIGGYDATWYCDAFGVNTTLSKITGAEEAPILRATLMYQYEIRSELFITLIGPDGYPVHPYGELTS